MWLICGYAVVTSRTYNALNIALEWNNRYQPQLGLDNVFLLNSPFSGVVSSPPSRSCSQSIPMSFPDRIACDTPDSISRLIPDPFPGRVVSRPLPGGCTLCVISLSQTKHRLAGWTITLPAVRSFFFSQQVALGQKQQQVYFTGPPQFKILPQCIIGAVPNGY